MPDLNRYSRYAGSEDVEGDVTQADLFSNLAITFLIIVATLSGVLYISTEGDDPPSSEAIMISIVLQNDGSFRLGSGQGHSYPLSQLSSVLAHQEFKEGHPVTLNLKVGADVGSHIFVDALNGVAGLRAKDPRWKSVKSVVSKEGKNHVQ